MALHVVPVVGQSRCAVCVSHNGNGVAVAVSVGVAVAVAVRVGVVVLVGVWFFVGVGVGVLEGTQVGALSVGKRMPTLIPSVGLGVAGAGWVRDGALVAVSVPRASSVARVSPEQARSVALPSGVAGIGVFVGLVQKDGSGV